MIKVVVSDVDGTLLDTADWILQAYLYVGERVGRPLSREAVLHEVSMGHTLKNTYAIFYPDLDFHALREKHREFQDANMQLVRPFPGVPETLQEIRKHGIKLVTMTNRLRDSSMKCMEVTGLKEYFDDFCCADDVLRPKPDPEHVYAALRLVNMEPKDAVVIGDSTADVQAGQRAGAKTIAVSYGIHGDLASLSPDHVVHSFTEVTALIFE